LLERLRGEKIRNQPALILAGKKYSYRDIVEQIQKNLDSFKEFSILPGTVVSVEGDFSFLSICDFLALHENKNIIVPINIENEEDKTARLRDACVSTRFTYSYSGRKVTNLERVVEHKLISKIKERNDSGLVLFSSGSTGKPKAILKDLSTVIGSYEKRGVSYITITILRLDHQGGIDVMLRVLNGNGVLVIPQSRVPEEIAREIDEHKIELFATTPTFLKLMYFTGVFDKFALSSLKYISYGAEPMPATLIKRLSVQIPNVKLRQTYGLSEISTFTSRPKLGDPLFMKINGDNFNYRVSDGELYLKPNGVMLGYLNAPDPLTPDGWYPTGDLVEEDEDGYIKIIGRKQEFINVGGRKVLPLEVEEIITEVEGVKDVLVRGEKNPIMGEVVAAYVSLLENTEKKAIKKRIIDLCERRLEDYKIPVKISFVEKELFGDRFKKNRSFG